MAVVPRVEKNLGGKAVNRFIRTMEEGLEKLGKKSETLVETTKVKLQISQLQKEVGEKQKELGALYYTLYKQESDEKEPLEKICLEIMELEKKILALEQEMGKKDSDSLICPKCNTVNSKNSMFCNNCGEKIQRLICQKCGEPLDAGVQSCASCEANTGGETPIIPDQTPAAAAGSSCPNCGADLEPEAKFCAGCGVHCEPAASLVPDLHSETETGFAAEPEAEPPQSAPEKTCSICGTKVEPGTQFCSRCGGSIP